MSAFERKFVQASEEVELGYNFAQEIHNIKEAALQLASQRLVVIAFLPECRC